MAKRVKSQRLQGRVTFSTGPWKGVKTTRDPWDDSPDFLQDLQNYYIPDPQGGSGAYARRGFDILNLQDPYDGRGQGVFSHVVNDNVWDFICAGGRLFRVNAGHTQFTDVTPVGVLIDPDTTHVYFTTFGEQLIISDGVNNPWIASDLDNTPITGTVIDYNGTGVPGSGDAWSAFGQPVVYAGSLFFILNKVSGIEQRTTITWSAPGNPAQGYLQDDGALNSFDYTWILEQTSAHPIYALAGTNVALFYFRDYSIGALAGTPGPDFQGSSTHDVVSVNVGCLQSATVQQYGQTIFFCDAEGRPYALQPGSPPIPIWLNMRQAIEDANSNYPTVTQQIAVSTIHPILNLYIVALFSPTAGVPDAPIEAYCFDTKTLAYVGRWSLKNGATWEAVGILSNAAGFASMIVLGDEPAAEEGQQEIITQGGDYINTQGGFRLAAGPALAVDWLLATNSGLLLTTNSGIDIGVDSPGIGRTGVVWGLDATIGDGDPITSEDGLFIITSEDGLYQITSENRLISWLDDGVPPTRTATTPRMGYSADTIYNVDQFTLITQSPAPVTVTMTTPTVLAAAEGTPTPFVSYDGTYRLVGGAEAMGRGVQVKIAPTTADDQHIIQSIGIVAVPSLADWNDA